MSSQADRQASMLRLLVLIAIVAIVVVSVAGRRQRGAGTAQAASTSDHRNDHKENLVPRKRMLTMAIGALENDWTRKAVIAGLKMARDRM